MKNNEIASFDSFEILNFDELENLCGGERFGEQAEAGKAAGFNCCNGSGSGSTSVEKI
ncbi:MAG: hypothetical protein HXO08_08685 [Prevotella salivae]|jgi:hypothetical protein|uniref:hypothetical protein n=1 Tax=Prevotella TaxID=838 RepID=UPI001304AF2D|nr:MULTISPECIES: hypothetical protein [Prevotella]MBF1449890.1 hypothetical protein [Segatella oris]MBF1551709.1 hypothetical protein [Segatella salivae]MBW4772810.1 hypothetical protein [Prevotella jejuni]